MSARNRKQNESEIGRKIEKIIRIKYIETFYVQYIRSDILSITSGYYTVLKLK